VSRRLFDELRIEQAVCRFQRMASSPAKARVRKFCPHPEEAAHRIRQQPSSVGGHPLGFGRSCPRPFSEIGAPARAPQVHTAADERGPAAHRQRQNLVSRARKQAVEYPPRLRSRCRTSSFGRAGVTRCPAFAGDDIATGMNVRIMTTATHASIPKSPPQANNP
jgi:hypothetical protein